MMLERAGVCQTSCLVPEHGYLCGDSQVCSSGSCTMFCGLEEICGERSVCLNNKCQMTCTSGMYSSFQALNTECEQAVLHVAFTIP